MVKKLLKTTKWVRVKCVLLYFHIIVYSAFPVLVKALYIQFPCLQNTPTALHAQGRSLYRIKGNFESIDQTWDLLIQIRLYELMEAKRSGLDNIFPF